MMTQNEVDLDENNSSGSVDMMALVLVLWGLISPNAQYVCPNDKTLYEH